MMLTLNISTKAENTLEFLFLFFLSFLFFFFNRDVNAGNCLQRGGKYMFIWWKACCCCHSVTQSCPAFCSPTDSMMPGFPVIRCFLEFAKTHVHCLGDGIQPSHSLSSPSPPAFYFSQHQGLSNESVLLLRWPNIGTPASASVLQVNIQD